ncbi:MAG: Protein of unknown function DUF86, BT0167 group [uncultured Thermomicrobiales bacterium]|uniref:DUF86 domain-containing protein n=1 Tax=uncultured Thermomicrobiales bacterium TaxID=1645740 RepID=A0A6J4VVC8_9BACT|nr:MAG: Protein of unknown function DUF86, BT0167 group [uncultured Thermomicrobiales bacterium]
MSPEVVERLGHALDSIDAIAGFIDRVDVLAYTDSRLHRRAVEREFEIIGEALSIAARLDQTLEGRIPDLRNAIKLRHRVIHGYETVDDTIVWTAAKEDLPRLRAQNRCRGRLRSTPPFIRWRTRPPDPESDPSTSAQSPRTNDEPRGGSGAGSL